MKDLYQKAIAKEFYEERYKDGYMDEWPMEKKIKVIDVIKSLSLPKMGKGLDFGCGNGVFTNVLKQALPEWEIYGSDISEVAVKNAEERYPDCKFFVSDNEQFSELEFDFLFSHHVLEHVFDIQKTISEINVYLKTEAKMLHILPCGNENSFEFNVCKLRTDGINKDMEDRFFFEDEGHVRRLTTARANDLMEAHNFKLEKGFYNNQYYNALRWITRSPDFIMNFTDPTKAINSKSLKRLKSLRYKLILLRYLQLPALLFLQVRKVYNKTLKHYLILAIDFVPYLVSYPFYSYIETKAEAEWDESKEQENGSEMYLYYERKQ